MTKKEILSGYTKNKRFVRTSLLFWLLLFLLIMALQFFGSAKGDYNGYIQVAIGIPFIMLIFYINFFLCAFYIIRRTRIYVLISLLLFTGFLLFVHSFSENDIRLITERSRASRAQAVFINLVQAGVYYIIVILISTMYWSLLYATRKTKENLDIQLRLQHMENEKVIAEKQFLQSQINPHFLYNTLNFFYAKSLGLSQELAESVLLLSDIMRYSLEKNENSNGMVLLQDEIGHINNVIRINQYRFNNRLKINFLVSGNTASARIIPLVLITLVENAFKHGELFDPSFPVTLALTIDEEKHSILFSVQNKKKTGPKEMGTGIGLENTRRRLNFAYGDKHSVIINDTDESYTATLQLPLFKDA